MALLPSSEWRVAEAIAGITTCNPFLPERLELEKKAIGNAYVDVGPVLRTRPGTSLEEIFPNIPAFRVRSDEIVGKIRQRLEDGHRATRDELVVYENLALYFLYTRYMSAFDGLVSKPLEKTTWTEPVPYWREFKNDFDRLFHIPGQDLPSKHIPELLFAGYFQIARAFTHIFQKIVGGSTPVAKLRAAVWESIFTHDMRRYIRSLHRKMADVPTLITGPSGSGKELVARAIGLSCFVPFNPGTRRFVAGETQMYVPLNLSALVPTLIESELFGHVKGAFTTAHKDREGWLERCGEHGAVFLDEIGELDAAIQVKLLRVLETRKIERVGSTDTLPFKGKIIAATNRDLAAEMQAGRFRHDLYYRLCADQVVTPSLAEQLADRPEDLPELVRFIAREVLGKRVDDPNGLDLGAETDDEFTEEVERLTAEVVAWIDRELSRGYAWPGNFRELGQCVRNVMTRGRLSWVQQNYIRAETITKANARLVNYQAQIPLAQAWGGGEVASADGLRFVVPVRTLNAGPNSKYFNADRGVTYYNFTSNQFTGIHAIVVPGTIRDSVFILEGLLEQQTSLRPHEVMSDTAGYSDLVFGLFWLLGYQFSPRLADFGEARFWRMDTKADYGALNGLARQRINVPRIVRNWDDQLRVAGSLKMGTVSGTELVRGLQGGGRPSTLGRAIGELGRVAKTLYLLNYLDDEAYRRRILTQLNRGESRHGVARVIFHGQRGELRQRYREGQEDQLGALGLVVNAVVLWNTRYLDASLTQVRASGGLVKPEDVERLSPLLLDHINVLGRYEFALMESVRQGRLRPLRNPDEHDDLAA